MARTPPAVLYGLSTVERSGSSAHPGVFFGGEVSQSPESSDSDSTDSEATLDETEICENFGHPLQRMFRVGSTDEDGPFFHGSLSRGSTSSYTSNSSWSSTSSVVYDTDYEELIDDLLKENSTFSPASPNMVLVEPSSPGLRDSLMIKCLPRASPELYLLLELNHKELRSDPWNPVPHLRCAVERGDNVYLCMEQLNPYDEPPFKTVANYLDFFRQVLEGLTFLHELNIGNVSFQHPSCYMVDLSSAPRSCASPNEFDRTAYPVRYYFTNLSQAVKYDPPTASSASVFRHDVQDCGVMIERSLIHVPRIEPKLKSLVKAMTVGGFGAEESRKLFEALCKSFQSSTLDTPAPPRDQCVRSNTTFSIPKRSASRKVQSSMSA